MGKFKRAWQDTKAKHSWFSQFVIALLAALLCWYLLPEKQAMDEIKTISIVAVSALIMWPIIEYLWHLACAPYRLEKEKNAILSNNDSEQEPRVITYNNCIVHQYSDGTSKSESTKITNEPAPTETSVAIAIPTLEIFSSYNVSSLTDNGEGDYTINFDNPLTGDYTVNVSSDECRI